MSRSRVLRFLPPAAALAALAVSAPGGASAAGCRGVQVGPSQSLQAAVDGTTRATTFCLKAGVHRLTIADRAEGGRQLRR